MKPATPLLSMFEEETLAQGYRICMKFGFIVRPELYWTTDELLRLRHKPGVYCSYDAWDSSIAAC